MSRLASNKAGGCGLAVMVAAWIAAGIGLVILGQHLGWW